MGATCSGGGAAWVVLKGVFFILATFVFSVIFWATKNWLEKGRKKKKK
tara:strand:+ start:548 stop:691 length:144 start_codon:yes stop_codon:yes gene_type:complete